MNEHKREHQQIADLPELNENKEKGFDNLQLPAFIVARFTNGCTYMTVVCRVNFSYFKADLTIL